jgi:hypothetical protein
MIKVTFIFSEKRREAETKGDFCTEVMERED